MVSTTPHRLEGDRYNPVLCRKCGMVLGTDLGHALLIGASRFHRSVTLTCTCCGECKKWTPAREGEDE